MAAAVAVALSRVSKGSQMTTYAPWCIREEPCGHVVRAEEPVLDDAASGSYCTSCTNSVYVHSSNRVSKESKVESSSMNVKFMGQMFGKFTHNFIPIPIFYNLNIVIDNLLLS